jgi:hypothetical protein
LDAVADAEQAGFSPTEDLSVADRQIGGSAATRAARQAEAQALAAQIRHRAALLVVSNREVATKITAAAGNIGEFSFDEPTGVAATPSAQQNNGIQFVDNKTWKQDPPPPRPHPDLPPEGVRPPVAGELTPGPASQSRARRFGGRSLWDQNGGEWRYFPGDEYRNPHWDYNPHDRNNSEWENIPIGGRQPHKEMPGSPAPQFPPLDMPDPPAAPAPIYTPPPGGPIINLPPISHDDAARAGTATGLTGIAGIFAWLALILEQN